MFSHLYKLIENNSMIMILIDIFLSNNQFLMIIIDNKIISKPFIVDI